jgi:8-oxo-dGTP pyrophosphatase MutT (NUDIX family)
VFAVHRSPFKEGFMERKHGPYTIRSSECLHRDEFVEMRLDEIVKPDGEPGRYATMRMRPGVAALPLDAEGFVYLVRMFRYAVGKECVEVVQGMVDEGEDERGAARRELREELGIEAQVWADLGLVDAITSQVFSPARVFLARGLEFGKTDREGSEKMQTVKVKFDEAVRMVMDGEITQGTSCVLILKASRVIADLGSRNAD